MRRKIMIARVRSIRTSKIFRDLVRNLSGWIYVVAASFDVM
jgi:hypothetical protein